MAAALSIDGAPFLPKLAQLAKGNLAFGVGLMVLLMVTGLTETPGRNNAFRVPLRILRPKRRAVCSRSNLY